MLPPSLALTEYIKRNHQSWYRFARDVYMLDIKEEDLVFVRGWVKTGQWAAAAATATNRAKGGKFSFSGDFSPTLSPAFFNRDNREIWMDISSRLGPEHALSDQCVFLHYYTLKRRLEMVASDARTADVAVETGSFDEEAHWQVIIVSSRSHPLG